MEGMVPAPPAATALDALHTAVRQGTGPAPADLLAAFAAVPDPRRARGRRFALARSWRWPWRRSAPTTAPSWRSRSGGGQRPEVLAALGFRDGGTPQQSTLQRLFRKLDPAALSVAIGRSFAAAAPAPQVRGGQGVALDGKAQRGRLAFAATTGGTVHALTAYAHDTAAVLAQEEIRSTAAKAEAALTVAPTLVARRDWRGRVLTGDALFCQRRLCRQVCTAGGDDLLLVKEHQPTL